MSSRGLWAPSALGLAIAAACGARSELRVLADAEVGIDVAGPGGIGGMAGRGGVGGAGASGGAPDAAADVTSDVSPLPCGDRAVFGLAFGAAGQDIASSIALAGEGMLVAAGRFSGTVDFDLGPGEARMTAVDGTDVFVTKRGCDGGHVWTRVFGGLDASWGDESNVVRVAADDSVFVGGQYCLETDFDPPPRGSGDLRASQGCFDAFLTRFAADGSRIWTRTWGGSGRDRLAGLALAADGSVFVAGQFEGAIDLDPGPGTRIATSVGAIDVFILKLDMAGNLDWARTWGGPEVEYAPIAVVVRQDGSLVVAGNFSADVDFDPSPRDDVRTSAGSNDVFVQAFDASGTRLWTRTFGGTGYESFTALAANADGTLAVSGTFYAEADFDPSTATDLRTPAGLYDSFLNVLDRDGARIRTLIWGGAQPGGARSMVRAVMPLGEKDWLVGGEFEGHVDFDPTLGTISRTSRATDAYVAAFSGDGPLLWVETFASDDLASANDVLALPGALAIAGMFQGSAELGPSFGANNPLTSLGSTDAFVLVQPLP